MTRNERNALDAHITGNGGEDQFRQPAPKPPVSLLASGFACMECGRKFRTVAAAERAANVGCPKCGGVDIDLS